MLELLRRTHADGKTNRIANRGPMRFLLLCVATCPATALLSPVPVRASPIVHSRSSMIVAQQQQLPPGWYTTVDPQSGQTYYCNEQSGQCQWDPPQMQGGAQQQQLPPGWYATVDPQSGQTWYCNEQSGQCQYDPPQY